jgi:hypothetical protein
MPDFLCSRDIVRLNRREHMIVNFCETDDSRCLSIAHFARAPRRGTERVRRSHSLLING